MNKIMSTAMRFAAISALAGCASVYRVSESAPDPKDGQVLVPPPPATRKPVVAVKAKPADAGARRLSNMLKSAAESRLAARGFDVSPTMPPDYTAAFSVSRREEAKLAEWLVYGGTVDARVTDATTGRLVANTTLRAKGERGLGESKAEDSLGNVLAPMLAEWMIKTVPSRKIPVPAPQTPNVAVMMLTLSPADPTEPQNDVLVAQRRFMDAVGRYPGIVSCRLAKEIPASRAFVFRVEYMPEQFPGGLLNTIVLDRPSLGGAKLEIVR